MSQERYGCCFYRINDSNKCTENTFNVYRLLSKISLVNVEVNLEEAEFDPGF